jgi:hypothetical protein
MCGKHLPQQHDISQNFHERKAIAVVKFLRCSAKSSFSPRHGYRALALNAKVIPLAKAVSPCKTKNTGNIPPSAFPGRGYQKQ